MKRAFLFILIAFGYSDAGTARVAVAECGSSVFSGAGSEAGFIECALAGTSRYHDRAAAILDGYRMIGSDFPSMGEHWINISLLFDGELDPERPEVLSYVVVSGKPRLLGVAYALPLLAGESAPEWPAGGAWHDHYRTLDDETRLPQHDTPGVRPNLARIAMMHAWIWSENPNGTFAADNWAIPYLRLDIPPPDGAPEAAAKAVSLLSGGADYFMASLDQMLSQSERQRVELALAHAESEVELLIRRRGAFSLTPRDAADLSEVWFRLWNTIDAPGAEQAPSHELKTDSH